MQVMTAATATNTAGRTTHRGGPSVSRPKKISDAPAMPTLTSSTRTSTTSAASAAGANGKSEGRARLVQRKPSPMPRKLPSRTTLEK
jgi:hypothetical protein